ncbi:L-fucose:H+ symporter permease [Bacillus ginsengihumi]|uniref:L-fucose:H+ symporter permease n=1 Tax=Heyndrickxia ginsengihumi TaxID=363870 RepID=A0A0A6VFW5_9BACI|nr:L-fucose:H+ symporter permease [Heyndrickxia ginsengihumi]KHD86298.1 sugar:proton symporter [Heyndrickxia ginsengihumi]MBE6185152.1 L-fucose:H+ symporter permease [Bacillus sp. (in: firmicutes)]MCM3023192.1 L-fucose:H+ symporter permease [Heyndrickxia ginsengihumi]NEY20020.1 L-fucose:H+ symporter permease [Heyndrickxia ginsengihumi]
MSRKPIEQMSDGYLSRTPYIQYILVSFLFPLWGAAASLNDILITQFKSVFSLSDFASALVQSAFYGGYFLIAIPASLVIKKSSYKIAIMTGLIFYILGCSLFFPASHMATYTMFLVALFAIAIGLSFLETSANTYSSMLGSSKYATLRLNVSQTFYPLGCILGILLGKYLIFGNGESLSKQMEKMPAAEAHAFGIKMLQHTLSPYRFMIFVLIAVLILFIMTKFPACKSNSSVKESTEKAGILETLKYLAHNSRFKKGIVAQFIYVGMQVTVWSFTIRLALELNHNINERSASTFMVYSYIAFFVGKFIANFLISRFSPNKVLLSYSVIGSLLLLYIVLVPNMTAVYAAIAVSVMFGPCWATIYAHTLEVVKDKKYVETAGAILVMAIIGGAIIPAVQGYVSDLLGSMRLSFIVPMICFIYVSIYFYLEIRNSKTVKKIDSVKEAPAKL